MQSWGESPFATHVKKIIKKKEKELTNSGQLHVDNGVKWSATSLEGSRRCTLAPCSCSFLGFPSWVSWKPFSFGSGLIPIPELGPCGLCTGTRSTPTAISMVSWGSDRLLASPGSLLGAEKLHGPCPAVSQNVLLPSPGRGSFLDLIPSIQTSFLPGVSSPSQFCHLTVLCGDHHIGGVCLSSVHQPH